MDSKAKRSVLICLLFASMLFAGPPSLLQAEGPLQVYVDEEPVSFEEQRPVIVEGRTLVPVRGVFEKMGFAVHWDPHMATVVIENSDTVIRIDSSDHILLNNTEIAALDVPPQMINGRLMLPLRAISELTGHKVDWVSKDQAVLITTKVSVGQGGATEQSGAHNEGSKSPACQDKNSGNTIDIRNYFANAYLNMPSRIFVEVNAAVQEFIVELEGETYGSKITTEMAPSGEARYWQMASEEFLLTEAKKYTVKLIFKDSAGSMEALYYEIDFTEDETQAPELLWAGHVPKPGIFEGSIHIQTSQSVQETAITLEGIRYTNPDLHRQYSDSQGPFKYWVFEIAWIDGGDYTAYIEMYDANGGVYEEIMKFHVEDYHATNHSK